MVRLLSITRRTSELSQDYFPPIELDSNSDYVLGLYSLNTYLCIPNIIKDVNNEFYYMGKDGIVETVSLPEGSYEIDDIASYINNEIFKTTGDGTAVQITPNPITFKVEFYCLYTVFMTGKSVASILGFSDRVLSSQTWHKSDLPVEISRIAEINVECNLIDSLYRNGKSCHTIYSFFPHVSRGHKISEHPLHPLYFELTTGRISHISLRITDQRGKLINFSGEEITIQLNLKKLL